MPGSRGSTGAGSAAGWGSASPSARWPGWLAAFLLGLLSTGPTAAKIGALAAQIGAAGGPPKPEQAAELARLQAKLAASSMVSTIVTTVALVFMAVARYL